MIFKETPLRGVFVIEPQPFRDYRGEFARIYCKGELDKQGLISSFAQENRVSTKSPGTIRGLHLQRPPHAEAKLVRCDSGRIYDVVVDCRSDSETFLHWFGMELTNANAKMLYVPQGFAHGYQTLTENAVASYLSSAFYKAESELQINCLDPKINIDWPINNPILSPKDTTAAMIADSFQGIHIS